mmetsp:Transcript_38158/g.107828  ORF Transcript_38158/g.107828 Transcript_38158/m.107828 type:complete len:97 (-) Transcript_38158:1294-1584(-)
MPSIWRRVGWIHGLLSTTSRVADDWHMGYGLTSSWDAFTSHVRHVDPWRGVCLNHFSELFLSLLLVLQSGSRLLATSKGFDICRQFLLLCPQEIDF